MRSLVRVNAPPGAAAPSASAFSSFEECRHRNSCMIRDIAELCIGSREMIAESRRLIAQVNNILTRDWEATVPWVRMVRRPTLADDVHMSELDD